MKNVRIITILKKIYPYNGFIIKMQNKIILENGATLLINSISHSNTVSIGFWVNVGSRDEDNGQHGYSHFIEHMLFKGTKNRSYLDIAVEVDELGGEINGATAKEFTYYYVNVAKNYFTTAFEILADMYFNPSFNENEFKKEKDVILDELDSANDDPEEFINDFFCTTLWGENSFGYPVIGTRDDIKSSSLKGLIEYYLLHYNSKNLIISVSGGLNEKEITPFVNQVMTNIEKRRSSEKIRERPKAIFRNKFQDRKIEQVYFITGRDAYSYRDSERYPMILLNSMIGGSFSSVLFQEVRERRGLCYSISSSYLSYSDIGEFSIGFTTSKKNLLAVLELINKLIKKIKKGLIKKEDLERAKKKFYGNYMLASESNEWLMSRLAINEMVFGKIIPFDWVMEEIRKVSLDDIYFIIDNIFKEKELAISAIGPEEIRNEIESFNFNF